MEAQREAQIISVQHIAPLSAEVVERIAAGEVIERPASVVRELIENALDAGATAIRIEIRDGGARLLRVSDDGAGIARDELLLAVQPHTTSKVGSVDDLGHLTTLGFRGEALASIAAVAELHIVSAADTSGLAAALRMPAPDMAPAIAETARSRGTTVTVRDLFAGVPARRALLRGPRTEIARVRAVVCAYALAHPDVSFTLIGDGYLMLQTARGTLASALDAIYSAPIAGAHVPVDAAPLPGVSITGAAISRAYHFSTREHVTVAVNGRPITNRALLAAAEAGYRPLLPKGRHPIAAICVTVDPVGVDANVHPAKHEVLLKDEERIAAALRAAIHQAMSAATVSVPAGMSRPTAPRFTRTVSMDLRPHRRTRAHALAEARAAYATWSAHAKEPPAPTGIPELTPLAQLGQALILAEAVDGALYLVDQHRAHERVLYEQLRQMRRAVHRPPEPHEGTGASPSEHTANGQLLLQPLLVELTAVQAEQLVPRLGELRALGLDCEPFGGSVFLVRAVPHLPGMARAPGEAAAEIAQLAAEESAAWMDAVCASIACRTAVRRGQALSLEEQRALLADLHEVKVYATCPHGSPLLLHYTPAELARAFEW